MILLAPFANRATHLQKEFELNKTQRGDIVAIRSAGAYGEVMASQYNCRDIAKSYFSDTI